MIEVFIPSSREDAIAKMFQVQTIPPIRNTVQSGDAAYYSSHPHGDFIDKGAPWSLKDVLREVLMMNHLLRENCSAE
jgi:hypothetical protein